MQPVYEAAKAYWLTLGKSTAQTALHFGANDLDGTITDGGELTHSYSVESNNEVKMTKQEIIQMIERRVQVFDADGRLITQWTGFTLPQALCLGRDQSIYVGDAGRVVKLDLTGRVTGHLGYQW